MYSYISTCRGHSETLRCVNKSDPFRIGRNKILKFEIGQTLLTILKKLFPMKRLKSAIGILFPIRAVIVLCIMT